ncbi:hypothetical protein [Actinomadura verrucosospora]
MFRLFRRRRTDELAFIDAEITALGEALARHPFVPEQHAADADLLTDYSRALDAYEQAKRAFVGDRDRADAADVLIALDEGRHALACVDARLAGHPAPPRRPLCFFDPRHGTSVDRLSWTPEGGVTRIIDVCAADGVRINEGMPPIATGRRPPPPPEPRAPAPSSRPRGSRAPAPAPRAPGEPAPYKTCPPGVRKSQRVQGRGAREHKFPYREPRVPQVLVVRLHGGERKSVVKLVEAGDVRVLLRVRGHRSRVVAPLPVREDKHVHLRIETMGRWSAWLQRFDTVPAARDHISSRGSFVFRYMGGPAIVQMTHAEHGDFSLTELTTDFEQGQRVLSGNGATYAEAHLPGSTYLHVRAEGDWRIRFTPL